MIGIVCVPGWYVDVGYVYVFGLSDVEFDQLMFDVVLCLSVDL